MSARAVALWIAIHAVEKYVFKSQAGFATFAAYVAYVFFSGYVSSVMQVQFAGYFPARPVGKGCGRIDDLDLQFHVLARHLFRKWSEI